MALILSSIKDRADYQLQEGEFLSLEQTGQAVVLVDSYAAENEIELGDSIRVTTLNGLEQIKVVGLIAKEGAGQLNNGAFGVIDLRTAQKLFDRTNFYDQIDIVAAAEYTSSRALEELRRGLQEYLGDDFAVIYPASQGRRMTQMLSNYQIGLNFMSGMALFVGAFLIYNAFSMSVVERTREFGMLRAVGMTRSQISRQVLREALFMGVFGSLLGVGAGLLMAKGLTVLMSIIIGQAMTQVVIPQNVVVTGFSVGVVVAVIAAVLPAMQAGRISPLEALRIRSENREGWLLRHGWIPGSVLLGGSAFLLILNPFPYDVQFRLGSMVIVALFLGGTLAIPATVRPWERLLRPMIRSLYGRCGQIGSSNIERSKLRTTLTVAALMVGVAMIVIVWIVTNSFKGDLNEWLNGYMGGDLYITSTGTLGSDVGKRLEAVPGVAAVAPVRYFEVEFRSDQGEDVKSMFMAFDPGPYTQVTNFVFSQAAPDEISALQQVAQGDAVFISSVIAEKYGLGVGDKISLKTRTGPHDFLITAVVVDYYNQGMVVSGSWQDMFRYFRFKDANTYLVKLEEGQEAAQIKEQIDALYGKRYNLIIMSNQVLLESISRLMAQAFSMFDVLALIAMLVGFFGITNTITMNVLERTREIGMLRGVGMTRGQVVRMILAEAAVMGLIGGILGLVFGVILAWLITLAMTTMSGYSLTFIVPFQRIYLSLVVAIAVSQGAAFLPALTRARTTPSWKQSTTNKLTSTLMRTYSAAEPAHRQPVRLCYNSPNRSSYAK